MDLVCDTTDSIGELRGVRNDLVGGVVAAIFFNRPAVVNYVVLDGSLEETVRVLLMYS